MQNVSSLALKKYYNLVLFFSKINININICAAYKQGRLAFFFKCLFF